MELIMFVVRFFALLLLSGAGVLLTCVIWVVVWELSKVLLDQILRR